MRPLIANLPPPLLAQNPLRHYNPPMPGAAHELLVDTLRQDPSLVGALMEKLTGRALPSGLAPIDSAVRFVKTAEVRPALLLAERHHRWAIV